MTNIKQIIPVSGQWYAHLYNEDKEIDLTWPVLCWGLTDSETVSGAVCGMVNYGRGIIPAPDAPVVCGHSITFLGYVDQETVDRWKDE